MAWRYSAMIKEEGLIPGNLESARFFHGRTAREIRRQRTRRFFDSRRDAVPEAISCIIERCGLTEVALETGFTIEMSNSPLGKSEGWNRFDLVASIESDPCGQGRSIFASHGIDGCVEFRFDWDHRPITKVRTIWIRVTPLDAQVLAWALGKDLFSSPLGEQTTLHEWFNVGLLPPRRGSSMILPGPPVWDYDFIGD